MMIALQTLVDNGCSDLSLRELFNATAMVEVRSQPALGSWPNQGPDTYVAVQVVPLGVEPLSVLNRSHAALRGIKLLYCGEGYRTRQATNRSALGSALKLAYELADTINSIGTS